VLLKFKEGPLGLRKMNGKVREAERKLRRDTAINLGGNVQVK
jgi:hypothetical protein